jgi:hypothetical protein
VTADASVWLVGLDAKLVTTVSVDAYGAHDRVMVWSRGGHAGSLIVDKGDGEALAARLLGGNPATHRIEGNNRTWKVESEK